METLENGLGALNADEIGGNAQSGFVGGGQTYVVGAVSVVTGFDPARDVLDLGSDSIHNQIPVDTPDGFMMMHMFQPGKSTLLEGVSLADLDPENFAPIADSHLQQDLSAALAWENGTGLVQANTVYLRSHEAGVREIVDFDPATDKISFFYVSVRGDGDRNFSVEETAEGVRFFNPLNGQSMTLRGITFDDLDSTHFEWRANQLEDNVAGRIGLDTEIDGFSYVGENIFSGKSVAMAGGVDRAPYHSQPDYTGTPISEAGYPDGPEDIVVDDTGDDAGTGGSGDTDDDMGTGDPDAGDMTGGGMQDEHDDGSQELDAALVVADDWGSGARLLLEISNADTFQFNEGWTVEFDFDPTMIAGSWNSSWTENADGTGIIVSDVGWNGTIQAGQTIDVGFQLNRGGLDEVLLNNEADFIFL